MKVLITGSHFTPAQAVIEELRKDSSNKIVYLGRNRTLEGDDSPSVESQILPKMGIKFVPITSGRLQRAFTKHTIPSLFKIPLGFIQAFFVILKEKPDVLLSFGGYVAVPSVFACWLLSIPVIVHEQTLVTGLSNRISSLFASKIAVSFDKDYSFSKEKTVLTGNPIRQELFSDNFRDNLIKNTHKLPVLYITGGNQGSHFINEIIENLVGELTENFFVVHQTGESSYRDFENLSEIKEELKYPERYLVKKWFEADDVLEIYSKVDLVISRAGANTLLELAYFGIPTIVIPLPYLYQDEQNVNATFFKKLGLCEIILQSDLTSELLMEKIGTMKKNIMTYKKNAESAKSVVIPDAAKRLALETVLLCER